MLELASIALPKGRISVVSLNYIFFGPQIEGYDYILVFRYNEILNFLDILKILRFFTGLIKKILYSSSEI